MSAGWYPSLRLERQSVLGKYVATPNPETKGAVNSFLSSNLLSQRTQLDDSTHFLSPLPIIYTGSDFYIWHLHDWRSETKIRLWQFNFLVHLSTFLLYFSSVFFWSGTRKLLGMQGLEVLMVWIENKPTPRPMSRAAGTCGRDVLGGSKRVRLRYSSVRNSHWVFLTSQGLFFFFFWKYFYSGPWHLMKQGDSLAVWIKISLLWLSNSFRSRWGRCCTAVIQDWGKKARSFPLRGSTIENHSLPRATWLAEVAHGLKTECPLRQVLTSFSS